MQSVDLKWFLHTWWKWYHKGLRLVNGRPHNIEQWPPFCCAMVLDIVGHLPWSHGWPRALPLLWWCLSNGNTLALHWWGTAWPPGRVEHFMLCTYHTKHVRCTTGAMVAHPPPPDMWLHLLGSTQCWSRSAGLWLQCGTAAEGAWIWRNYHTCAFNCPFLFNYAAVFAWCTAFRVSLASFSAGWSLRLCWHQVLIGNLSAQFPLWLCLLYGVLISPGYFPLRSTVP